MSAVADVTERLEVMHAKLRGQRRVIDEQLTALESVLVQGSAMEPSGNCVVALYLAFGSARGVTEFANQQGWKLPSKKGAEHPPRQWQPEDVYALIRGESVPGVVRATNEGLMAMGQKAAGFMPLRYG